MLRKKRHFSLVRYLRYSGMVIRIGVNSQIALHFVSKIEKINRRVL